MNFNPLIPSCIFLIVVSAQSVTAQPAAIHSEILTTYNFQPHLLSDAQIEAKSGTLDRFWAKAKSQQATYLPAIRLELARADSPRFFLYDGSMLLLSLSKDPADRKIALGAIARCDLRDVQPTEYFQQVQHLAALSEDTTVAAFHILEQAKFTVSVPQHALTLSQNYALVYLLIPTEPAYWLNPAIARLAVEKDETAQKSLLLLLWYAQTEATNRAMDAFAADASKPAAPRAYARELGVRRGDLTTAQRAQAQTTSESSLRETRRKRMANVSDEALEDLDLYTVMLISKRK